MLIYPVFIPFQGCPFRCIYCQQETITHQKSDAQIIDTVSIKQFIQKHQHSEKEIAFFGGTFTALDQEIQALYFEQIRPLTDNRTTFRVSTRPDYINAEILSFLKENHVTTIELGIQSFQNKVLSNSKRGYSADQAIESCRLIKDNHFKLCIQLMPGLPGDTFDTFSNSIDIALSLHPEYMRLYPTIILKGTELERLFNQGLYHPWTLDEALMAVRNACLKTDQTVTKIIKIGLHSDLNISNDDVVSGPWHQNFGEMLKGIIFLEKCLSQNFSINNLYISRFEASSLLGNEKYVLSFCKDTLQLSLPEKILIDKNLVRSFFYFSDNIKEKI